MQAFIVSDHETTSVALRQALLQMGQSCPAAHVVPLTQAFDRVAQVRPELILVVLPPDAEHALLILTGLRLRTQAHLLAVGPTNDSRLVLRVLRSGAADYLDEANVNGDLRAALGRLEAELAAREEPGKMIGLLGPNGGSGASTLAVNLATVLAQEHRSSLLIDLKLQTGDLAALLDLKPTYTLADLCQNVDRVDRVMFERSLVRHTSGAHLLAPPGTLAEVVHVTPEGVQQAINLGRALFPYVLVDLDHTFGPEQVQVLRGADEILLVLRLDFASLRNAQRTLDHLAVLGVAADRIHLVVNRHGQPKEVPAAKAEEALGRKIFHYVPEDPKAVNRANNNGVPVVLESPSAGVSRSVTKLAASLNGRSH
jgi:pilus assembly protein CpaE